MVADQNIPGSKYRSPWKLKERQRLAMLLNINLISNHNGDVIGVGEIEGYLDMANPKWFKEYPYVIQRRIISYTMHDIGCTPRTRGRFGRVISWNLPRKMNTTEATMEV